MTIYADGSGWFEAVTFTNVTHSGDVWHAGFSIQDKDGVELYATAIQNSPRMNDGSPPPRYRWGFDFQMSAADVPNAFQVVYEYSC